MFRGTCEDIQTKRPILLTIFKSTGTAKADIGGEEGFVFEKYDFKTCTKSSISSTESVRLCSRELLNLDKGENDSRVATIRKQLLKADSQSTSTKSSSLATTCDESDTTFTNQTVFET